MKKLSALALIGLLLLVFSSCNGDDADPMDLSHELCGLWTGERTLKTGSVQTLEVSFFEDHTGELEYTAPSNYELAKFTWTFSKSTVYCKGIIAGIDGTAEELELTLEYNGQTLKPIKRFSPFTLTKYGHQQPSEKPDDKTETDKPNEKDDTENIGTNDYKKILTEIGRWTNNSGARNLIFYGTNDICYQEMSSKTLGSMGRVNLDARGTYSLSNSKIVARYTNVTWEGPSYGLALDYFPGWTYGKNRTVTYKIISLSRSRLRIENEDGKTLDYKPL